MLNKIGSNICGQDLRPLSLSTFGELTQQLLVPLEIDPICGI